jgi:fructokinase
MSTLLVFGEVLWDILPSGEILGGAPLNLAYRFFELGHRALVASRIGSDARGKAVLDTMREMDLDRSLVQYDPVLPTGTVLVSIGPDGQPDFVIRPDVAYDAIGATDALLDSIPQIDILAFGTLIRRSPKSAATLDILLETTENAPRAPLRFLDINLRRNCYTAESVDISLRHADIAKANADEIRALIHLLDLPATNVVDGTRALVDRYCLDCAVTTLGPDGSICVAFDGSVYRAPGYTVNVIDACGSGDAFSAAFLDAWIDNLPPETCCQRGNALGAFNATRPGATHPISPAERDQWFKNLPAYSASQDNDPVVVAPPREFLA